MCECVSVWCNKTDLLYLEPVFVSSRGEERGRGPEQLHPAMSSISQHCRVQVPYVGGWTDPQNEGSSEI